jgi:hypothetical protein
MGTKTTLWPLSGPEREAARLIAADHPMDLIERETGLSKVAILAARDLAEQWAKVVPSGESNGHPPKPVILADTLVPVGGPRRAADPVFRAPVAQAPISKPAAAATEPTPLAEAKPDPETAAVLDKPPLAVEIDVPVFARGDANAVLAEAEKSSDPELRAEALAIRGFVAALEVRLATSEEERVARIVVDELRKQVAKAEAHLAQLLATKRGPVTTVVAPAAPTAPESVKPKAKSGRGGGDPLAYSETIRSWARENGLKVGAAGRMSMDLVNTYLAAHPEAAK